MDAERALYNLKTNSLRILVSAFVYLMVLLILYIGVFFASGGEIREYIDVVRPIGILLLWGHAYRLIGAGARGERLRWVNLVPPRGFLKLLVPGAAYFTIAAAMLYGFMQSAIISQSAIQVLLLLLSVVSLFLLYLFLGSLLLVGVQPRAHLGDILIHPFLLFRKYPLFSLLTFGLMAGLSYVPVVGVFLASLLVFISEFFRAEMLREGGKTHEIEYSPDDEDSYIETFAADDSEWY